MATSLLHRAGVLAAGSVLSLGLVGCGGDSDSVTVPDGKGGSVTVDQGEDGVTIDTEDGSITSGTKLPDDFPVDKVPLIDGDVVSAISADQTGGGGFNVVVSSSKSDADALSEAVDLLTQAGYEKSEAFDGAGANIAGLESADYSILVQIVDVGSGTSVSYTVAPASS